MLTAQLGATGEAIAASFLRQKGYSILHCNWRQWRHELDIIAQDDETLVFVEVRTRSSTNEALISMNPKKCKSLWAAAQAFLTEQNLWSVACRFDLICVANHGNTLTAEHHVNIDLTSAMAGGHTSWQPW